MKTQTANLEQRLLVALSARGSQRIGQFIENAVALFGPVGNADAFYLSDEDLVSACEREVGR